MPNEGINLGPLTLRFYSLCWIIGLGISYFIVRKLYKEQKLKDEDFEPLFFYCFMGILIGARLGHCLFYEPGYYMNHIAEMFLPMKETAQGWKFTGYEGLASHGGGIGLLTALYLYYRKVSKRISLMRIFDNIAIALPLCGCFIRLGNLMNSEIIGAPTNLPWGFIFHTRSALIDGVAVPRHPAQLYEAIAYLIFFLIGWFLYRLCKNKMGTGFFTGLSLVLIFSFRFAIEFLKEVQGGSDDGSTMLDLGQMLSIPFIIFGIACLIGGKWIEKLADKK